MGNTARFRRFGALVATAALASGAAVALPAAKAAEPGTYSNPDYLLHDGDNVTRSFARQSGNVSDPAYQQAFLGTAAKSWLALQGRQLDDLRRKRIYGTLGELLPGGAVGDPKAYASVPFPQVFFKTRPGAQLSGRCWGADAPAGAPAKPAVVITTGSIQGTQHMYWWAARTLATNGYVVFTWDVQGQGESETFGHTYGTGAQTNDGVPFQQEANFTEGTVDALRFFLSDSVHPYRPLPRTTDEVQAEQALERTTGEGINWFNPLSASFDHSRLGIVGHSLGASAVSKVQQCSSDGTLWTTLPLCQGTPFPIKAVIGWDSLSSTGIVPVVPAMDQHADGYFLNPQPSPNAPDPTGHLAPLAAWRKAGIDTYSFTVRGGCHTEWTEIPYISFGTSYGLAMADYYTLAWFDRYVKGDPSAATRLLAGPRDGIQPWSAHGLSANYLGGFTLHDPAGALVSADDLRAYSGLSLVGDWKGANADTWGAYSPR